MTFGQLIELQQNGDGMKLLLSSLAFVAFGIFLILVSLPQQLYVLTLLGAVCVLGGPIIGLIIRLVKAVPGPQPEYYNWPTPQRPTRCGFGGQVHHVGSGHPGYPAYQGKCDCGYWVGPVRTSWSLALQDLSVHSYGIP
jgi:hypothetical protein